MQEENNAHLNNVVYNLDKITNPKLKQALKERSEQQKFMFSFLLPGGHKDYTAYHDNHATWRSTNDHTEHTDIARYDEHSDYNVYEEHSHPGNITNDY